ncbi:hypothetical protein CVT26_006289, partial [Gymnopilus dilepis]
MPRKEGTEPKVHTIMSKPFTFGLECCIARNPYPGNQYFMVFGRGYGMADSRILQVMNCSTCGPDKLELSEKSGRPLIWYDSDLERRGRG